VQLSIIIVIIIIIIITIIIRSHFGSRARGCAGGRFWSAQQSLSVVVRVSLA
jgi:hypothetical protein